MLKRVPPKGAIVRGIDIYHNNLISDWNQLKSGGIEYVFLKCTEFSIDPKFKARWQAAKQFGFVRGAYHFFHPGRDPKLQAESFLASMGPLEKGDLPATLDWESSDGIPSAQDRTNALIWLGIVENATKMAPLIYTSPYFSQSVKMDIRFSKFGLWIANYNVSAPTVPYPWNNWLFWQNSESEQVLGVNGACDYDIFNGTLEELKALTFQG